VWRGVDHAAMRSVLFCARAQAHGMRSSMREAGHRLTSLVKTSSIGLRINTIELAGLDQRGDGSPVGRALVAAGEQRVLSGECNLAVILPISGMTLWSNIAGIRCTDRGCVVFRASGAHRVSWCTWS
jgi:hypothetical protein